LLLDKEVCFFGFCGVDFKKDLIIYKVGDGVNETILLEHAVHKSKVECLIFEILINRIIVFAHNPRGFLSWIISTLPEFKL